MTRRSRAARPVPPGSVPTCGSSTPGKPPTTSKAGSNGGRTSPGPVPKLPSGSWKNTRFLSSGKTESFLPPARQTSNGGCWKWPPDRWERRKRALLLRPTSIGSGPTFERPSRKPPGSGSPRRSYGHNQTLCPSIGHPGNPDPCRGRLCPRSLPGGRTAAFGPPTSPWPPTAYGRGNAGF